MYPQGVCRIRKPAYAGNGCAIFLVFQTEEMGQKDGCGLQTQLCGVAFIMNNFVFENKTKVYFGKGGVKEYLGCLLKDYGETVMLAYGGGSVSDCCKVVSAQAKLSEDIWEMEYMKHTYPTESIPLCTIVTVFGTGSEMNNGAVITNEEKKIKGALWGAQASYAFLDPEYTMFVPMKQVISGAFDTLSHAMETYFGKPDENNLSDDMNEAVMRSVIRNIRVLLKDPNNYNARSELAWAWR